VYTVVQYEDLGWETRGGVGVLVLGVMVMCVGVWRREGGGSLVGDLSCIGDRRGLGVVRSKTRNPTPGRVGVTPCTCVLTLRGCHSCSAGLLQTKCHLSSIHAHSLLLLLPLSV